MEWPSILLIICGIVFLLMAVYHRHSKETVYLKAIQEQLGRPVERSTEATSNRGGSYFINIETGGGGSTPSGGASSSSSSGSSDGNVLFCFGMLVLLALCHAFYPVHPNFKVHDAKGRWHHVRNFGGETFMYGGVQYPSILTLKNALELAYEK